MAVPDFRHDELPDASRYIRLLEVLEAPEDGQIECRLTTWLMAYAPSYTAISYTWGDPADTTKITVNSTPMIVRSNCAYVLRQASWQGSAFIWVDAICIDQMNNIEKGHQVRMMGEIYRNAKTVLACVGSDADDSDYLCHFLQANRSSLLYFADQVDVMRDGLWISYKPYVSTTAHMSRLFRSIRWRFRHSLAVQRRILPAVPAMLERPYFRRAWIAQELYLATDPVLCCGTAICDLAALAGLVAVSTHNDAASGSDISYSIRERIPWSRIARFDRVFVSSVVICDLKVFRLKSIVALARLKAGAPPGFQDILRDTSDLQCTDPRDKIYAVLGIVESDTARHISVDYSKTCFQLATQLFPVLLGITSEKSTSYKLASSAEESMRTVIDTIKLQSDDASYVAAIAARRSPLRMTALTGRSSANEPRRHLELLQWYSFRIQDRHLEAVGDEMADLQQSRLPRTFQRIKNTNGKTAAIVSAPARPGDWIAFTDGVNACLGLILRKSSDGIFDIIGTAILFGWNTLMGKITHFTVHFDIEDYLTTYYHYMSFVAEKPSTPRSCELPLPLPRDAVTLASGESGADSTSWPPPLGVRSNNDLAQYFSVDVCYQPRSSYAELEES